MRSRDRRIDGVDFHLVFSSMTRSDLVVIGAEDDGGVSSDEILSMIFCTTGTRLSSSRG